MKRHIQKWAIAFFILLVISIPVVAKITSSDVVQTAFKKPEPDWPKELDRAVGFVGREQVTIKLIRGGNNKDYYVGAQGGQVWRSEWSVNMSYKSAKKEFEQLVQKYNLVAEKKEEKAKE